MPRQVEYHFFFIFCSIFFIANIAIYSFIGSGGGEMNSKKVENAAIKQVAAKEVKDDDNSDDDRRDFIFIGGFPRSGTTLMRAMLEAHPDIRCGEETKTIPHFLELRDLLKANRTEWQQIEQLGLDETDVDLAFGDFIASKIVANGEPAPRLCNKDPFALKWTTFLAHSFPRARFVLMLRDGRAVAHSLMEHNLTHECVGTAKRSAEEEDTATEMFKHCLGKWNTEVESMYAQCLEVGPAKCLPIHYEELVRHPKREMWHLLRFLNLPWNPAVLHHEQLVGKKIMLSETGLSTEQVRRPLSKAAITKWALKKPYSSEVALEAVAPMLRLLGYLLPLEEKGEINEETIRIL